MLLWLDIAIAVAGDRGKGERELMVMYCRDGQRNRQLCWSKIQWGGSGVLTVYSTSWKELPQWVTVQRIVGT